MKKWMGEDQFNKLRTQLNENEFKDQISGEPDLFCWEPNTGQWFFAEAKKDDNLHEKQFRWFDVCHDALGDAVDIRVYRMVPVHMTNVDGPDSLLSGCRRHKRSVPAFLLFHSLLTQRGPVPDLLPPRLARRLRQRVVGATRQVVVCPLPHCPPPPLRSIMPPL